MANLSVIILTYNEEIHIERCLKSAFAVAKEVFVIDSYSSDRTTEIAEQSGSIVLKNAWPGNQAAQFNWALDNAPITQEWVLRLDADEYLSEQLVVEINEKLNELPQDVTGVVLPFQRVFLGRMINRGTAGIKMLRLFRYKAAVCEDRWMDEHIKLLRGKTVEFTHSFADDNLNNLSWWTEKHVKYAIREAVNLLDLELGLLKAKDNNPNKLSQQAQKTREKKTAYAKQPLFWRAFLYFIYRYIFKLGFLEGREGFLWHFLQGWWYRTLVDAKVLEIKRACGTDIPKIRAYLKKEYGIQL